jgi:hypothetical protein
MHFLATLLIGNAEVAIQFSPFEWFGCVLSCYEECGLRESALDQTLVGFQILIYDVMDLITVSAKHLFSFVSADGEGFLEAAQGVPLVIFKRLFLTCLCSIHFFWMRGL